MRQLTRHELRMDRTSDQTLLACRSSEPDAHSSVEAAATDDDQDVRLFGRMDQCMCDLHAGAPRKELLKIERPCGRARMPLKNPEKCQPNFLSITMLPSRIQHPT